MSPVSLNRDYDKPRIERGVDGSVARIRPVRVVREATITDSAFQGIVNDTGSAGRGALDDLYAPILSGGKGVVRKGDLLYNVRDYGAVGDGLADDTAAVQAWTDAVIAAEGTGYAPPGDYLLESAITHASVDEKRFSLVGAGVGVTRFIVPATNTTGGLHFTSTTTRGAQLTARDFTVLTQGVGNGTGLKFSMSPGGNQHQRSVVLENIEVKGEDITTDVFDIGIDLTGTWRPYLRGVVIGGPYGPGVSSDLTDASPMFVGSYALILDSAYDWTVDNSYIWSAHTAISDIGTDAEAGRLINTVINGCRIGLDRFRTSTEPVIWIDNSHVNFRDYGLRINGARMVVVQSSHFYNEDSTNQFTGGARDILLDNTERTIVAENVFHFTGATDRINVFLETATLGTGLLVKGNLFGATAANAVFVGAAADDVMLVGNYYPGAITQRVADNSGKVVAFDYHGDAAMRLVGYSAGSESGPFFRTVRESPSPAASDALGSVQFAGRSSSGAEVEYATVRAQIIDPTAGSEDGAVQLFNKIGGADVQVMQIRDATVDTNTAMFLLVNTAGTVSLRRVTVGAADSGGAGFRVLRVAN